MSTLLVDLPLLNPTDISLGMRPRQSNVIVRRVVMNVTSASSEKFCVVTVPESLKSIVTAYVLVSSICIVAVACRRTASERIRSA